eukprot:scaffold492203_cov22-Prasinocladus_malaysianus.AAC.1
MIVAVKSMVAMATFIMMVILLGLIVSYSKVEEKRSSESDYLKIIMWPCDYAKAQSLGMTLLMMMIF